MQKLLTIVVPVYKVEQYINKCLDSCIVYKADGSLDEEKMNQLEVIIVNDGTPDNSAELSRVYTKRYPQTFRQIDKENGGHGSAWNVGLKEAIGKYLRFLDSDDWLTNLDKLMEKLQDCDADLVFTPMNEFRVLQNEYVRVSVNGITNLVQKIEEFPYKDNTIMVCNFHCCTYKSSILKMCYPLFDEHVPYDDMILFVAPIIFASSYVIYEFPLYQYLIGRVDQTMSPATLRKNREFLFKAFNKSLHFVNEYAKSDFVREWTEFILQQYISIMLLSLLHLFRYRDSRKKAIEIKKILKNNSSKSKMCHRLISWPFLFYWIYENIRSWKNETIK